MTSASPPAATEAREIFGRRANVLQVTDDHQLVEAWRGGDRGAGEALIARHYDAITRFFASKAGNQAEDLTQRTFLVCASSLDGFRAEGRFRAYLFGIARNVLYEHIRRRVRDGKNQPDFNASSIADLSPGVATLAARNAEHKVLGIALQNIPVDLQILLELYYWEDLRLDELAEVLGVPQGTIKSRLHRARSLLREAIERCPGTPEEQESASLLLSRWAAGVRGRLDGPDEPI
jgi:RNA polymerase sigma factor (sigma-70 family)